MQPYFFPFIGYFQLINACDLFVIYDDVNFIKGGWINRNRILENGIPSYINVEINGLSSNRLISELEVRRSNWNRKLIKRIQQVYRRAPYFDTFFPLISEILYEPFIPVTDLNIKILQSVMGYLGIDKVLKKSSDSYDNHHLSGEDRVIDICLKENAKTYINPINGQSLYSMSNFSSRGLNLQFLKRRSSISYTQIINKDFVPDLSILDVLMYNSVSETNEMLKEYDLISK